MATESEASPKKRRFVFPDSLVLIFGLVLVAQLATYVLPSGEYKTEGRKVLPGTYHAVDAKPLGPLAFLTSIPKGAKKSVDVIFFVFVVGGVISILRATGAIDAVIAMSIRSFGESQGWLIAGTMALLAVGSSTIGMAEEYMPFIPVLVTMCLALKLDAIVAMAIVYVAAGVGYGCAALNPFTVLIAQKISGVPAASGQLLRWSLLLVCLAVGVAYVLRYAKRVKNDPSRSLVNDVDYTKGFEMPEDVALTWRRITILAVFAISIGIFIWGVKVHEWYLTELCAIFFILGIISAALAPMSPNKASRVFCAGAAELTTAALLIGFARTIEVVLSDGKVIHTVIYGIASALESLPNWGAAVGMLGVQAMINLFIPSGSGQAYVTMPIMAPLADVTGLKRPVAVLAYQFGDGFTNMVVPTNALLMGMLGLARIPFDRWLRFVMPLLLWLYAVAAAALIICVVTGYGG